MASKKTYKILLHAKVPKELKALPKMAREQVTAIIDRLATDPIPPTASKLQGRTGCYRIRVGNYRIVYEVHVTEIIVYIIGVAHRREIYRTILRRRTK